MGEQPSSELQEFSRQLVESVREVSRQEAQRLAREFSAIVKEEVGRTEERLNQRIEAVRLEIRDDLVDIKDEQRRQGATLNQHTAAIAEIKVELRAGEQRFLKIEEEQRQARAAGKPQDIAVSPNAPTLATKVYDMSKGGIAPALGAGLAAFIAKMLGA